jgi:UDP-4-amino-4-deoxy-L-arabinose formyltransferase/UDP-glucuronic acid dehydrogenase (UDP-4-keto-hexauronic acid decarboxylating)
MVRFVVVGEGRPAKAIVDAIIRTGDATIEALLFEEPARNPLAEFATRQGITVIETRRIATECARMAHEPNRWLISANSTLIIPPEVLGAFDGRSLNFHPGLLPEYAGLHTHQWAIRNAEQEFGVTIHRLERRLDAGAIVAQARFPVRPQDTGLSLFGRCLAAGAELFSQVVTQIVQGEALIDFPQDLTRRRLYRHRDALDDRIGWDEDAMQVINFIRAGNYEPFASPTHVARLDRMAGFDIEVLRAVGEGTTCAPPGTVIDADAAGPLIACGDGATIRIVRARSGGELISPERWREYVSQLPERRLLGRALPLMQTAGHRRRAAM